ncbi:unnamed protein product, partial [Didymodactylos carnosus]
QYEILTLKNNHFSDTLDSIHPHNYGNGTFSKLRRLDRTNTYFNELKMKQSSSSAATVHIDKPKRSSSMITTSNLHKPRQTTSTTVAQSLTPTSSFSSIILTDGMNEYELTTTPVKKSSVEINRRKTIATCQDFSQKQKTHHHSRIDDNNKPIKPPQQRDLAINNDENSTAATILRRRRIIDFSRRRTVAATPSSKVDNNNNKENYNENKKPLSLSRKESLTKPIVVTQKISTNNVSSSTSSSTSSSFAKADNKKEPVIELIQPPPIYQFTSSPLTQLPKKYYFYNNNPTSSDNESVLDDALMSSYGLLQNSDYIKQRSKNRNSIAMVSWQAPQQQQQKQHSLPMPMYKSNNDSLSSKKLTNFHMISQYSNRSNKRNSRSSSPSQYQPRQLINTDPVDDLLCDREVESYFYPNSSYSLYDDSPYEFQNEHSHLNVNIPSTHQQTDRYSFQITKPTLQNMTSAIINSSDYYGTLC